MASRARKAWQELKPAYRARMARHGATESNWQTFDRTVARGHGATPEKPKYAAKNPQKYSKYIEKRAPKESEPVETRFSLAQQVIARKQKLFGEYIKFNAKHSKAYVYKPPTPGNVPPTEERMRRFLRMKDEELAEIEWSENEWAFLYYH